MSARNRAIKRVKDNTSLRPFEHILLNHNWPNQIKHYKWVANMPLDNILGWCQEITRKHVNNNETGYCMCRVYDWPMRPCVYLSDMHDDYEDYCRCCPYCQKECAEDL